MMAHQELRPLFDATPAFSGTSISSMGLNIDGAASFVRAVNSILSKLRNVLAIGSTISYTSMSRPNRLGAVSPKRTRIIQSFRCFGDMYVNSLKLVLGVVRTAPKDRAQAKYMIQQKL